MNEIRDAMVSIIGARPVGSEANNRAVEYLRKIATGMGYEVSLLPFSCNVWESKPSIAVREGTWFTLYPSPFSQPFDGEGEVITLTTLEELKSSPIDLSNKILILSGKIAADPLQPKNFPFYYPDEHKQVIDLLEEKRPLAVIAVTGKHPMCGWNPFPLFEDGNFSIPSAYIAEDGAKVMLSTDGPIRLRIGSEVKPRQSNQLIAAKKGKNPNQKKIIVCAHLDTKYNTPGALDNGSGITVLAGMMKRLHYYDGPYALELIPFNGEEYYEAKGEVEYLNRDTINHQNIGLVINIDSPGFKNSPIALSYYNLSDSMAAEFDKMIKEDHCLEMGSPWYAGDHSMFAFRGVPCLAVTSGGLFEHTHRLIHTPQDTVENIDFSLLDKTVEFLANVVAVLK